MISLHRRPSLPGAQRGASAIEFALVFPLLFLLFYGLVCWGLVLTLQENINYAAQGAARAALQVDPQDDNYTALVEQQARTTAGKMLDWMPATWKDRILGSGNSKVQVALQSDASGDWVQVRILYPDYSSNPLLPVLNFPGVGSFPPMPDQLVGEANLRL